MKTAKRLALISSLIVFVAACSQPKDLTTPELATQFGTAYKDIGVDVASRMTDRVYVLSAQNRTAYDPYYDAEADYGTVFLSRYNSEGALAWSKKIIEAECVPYEYLCDTLFVVSLESDAQGNAYALTAYDSELYGDYGAYANTFKVWKYTAAGSLSRSFVVGQNIYSAVDDDPEAFNAYVEIASDSVGNIYSAGVDCTPIYDEDDETAVVDGNCAYYVSKFSNTGTRQWRKTSTVGVPTSIAVTSAGNVYVLGRSGLARYNNSGALTWTKTGSTYAVGPYSNLIASGTNVFSRNLNTIRKYDANGALLWTKAQSGLTTMVIQDLTSDTGGNLYISGKYTPSGSKPSAFVRKLSTSGATLYTKTYGTTAYDDARGVSTVSGNEVYLAGETQGALAPPYRGGEGDAYVRKLSSSGNPVWTK